MRHWLRSHLTYANVMVTLLAFIVLTGGTAVALSGSNTVFTDDVANDTQPASGGNPAGGLTAADLRPNSVTASEVANPAIGSSEVAPEALIAADLSNNSVGTSEVANGSLDTADLAGSIPAAHVTHSATQNVPFTMPSQTTLAFSAERYDTQSMHDNATNNSRLTAPVNGIYAVTAQLKWQTNPTGFRRLLLRKNGTTDIGFVDSDATTDVAAVTQETTTQVRLAAGDYVEVVVEQFTNPNVTLVIAKINETTPEFSMTWLAPGP